MKIYNGYDRLARNYTLLTDEYELSMAKGYLSHNIEDEEVVFDVFFRKVPNDGGYAVMAGLDQIIPYIQGLKFDDQAINYLKRKGYGDDFINYAKNFKFTGDIYAIPDGTPIFPNEPIITVKAPLSEAQVIETALLSITNGAISHATAARRIVEAADGIPVMEFGARRADGLEAAIDSSIYAIMAGCVGTSNVIAADMMNITGLGTMAHSWVQSFPSELEAFMAYAAVYPNNCTLLVDTYDTLRSGVPNAIKTFEFMRDNGIDTSHIGIRIDSGDLTRLTKEARKMLDYAGFPQAKICVSDGLTPKRIESLKKEGAKIDSIGNGDAICKPQGNVGCVYKLVAVNENGEWIGKIKISEDDNKTINPDYKNLYRVYDKETGLAYADVMTRKNEKIDDLDEMVIKSVKNDKKWCVIKNFKLRELQKPIFKNGELVYYDPEIEEKKDYCEKQMNTLYPEVKRLEEPQEYYVDGTENYVNYKNDMILRHKKVLEYGKNN